MQKIKRVIAALLVAMTILSCNVTGFAAAKPSVTLMSKSTVSVKRGKSTTVKFKANSGSYKKKGNKYRSVLWLGIYYKNFDASSYVNNTAYMYWFTGNYNINHKVKVNKKADTGKYYLVYDVVYDKKGATEDNLRSWNVDLNTWKVASYDYMTIKVKK